MVEMTVADTGPGISAEIAERLFRPFITTKRHGMGIGLSISRTIIEAHGGELWVRPNAGGGTVFHLTLRAASNEERINAG
jgi:two-component system sensor kinase FixL